MKIIFLGVGEAFDENLPNNSQLIITDKTKLLLDCGFTVPPQLWKYNPDYNFLDAIYISHQHADHYFGLPAILLRMWEGGREKDLTIICSQKLKNSFEDFMNLAYEGLTKRFKYKINFIETKEENNIEFNDLRLSFKKTTHSQDNLAIKIINNKVSMVYSGDGAPRKIDDFYKDLDLLIQETYFYDQEKISHASIVNAIKFSEENNIKCLTLTHINRDFRKNDLLKMRDKIKSDKVKIIIPEPFDEYNL